MVQSKYIKEREPRIIVQRKFAKFIKKAVIMNLFVKEMLVHRKLIILAKRLMKKSNRTAAM